jgi:4-hydroxy-4-methyl-2-oxoglutarate aldolase
MIITVELPPELDSVSTAHLADACLVVGVEVRCAPSALRPVSPDAARFAAPAQPVRHTGSVDVILEAVGRMVAGGVLVVDDDGRTDRACIGDLTALEARKAGAAAMIANGLHRDTDELIELGLPVFSLGSSPTGPLEWFPSPPDALDRCHLGDWEITRDDIVVGDRDGVIVLPANRIDDLVAAAVTIRDRERHQAQLAHGGTSLREQFDFTTYLADRARHPERTFREHLTDRSAAIEA